MKSARSSGRNPILAVRLAAGLMDRVLAEKPLGHAKTSDIAFARRWYVPVARDFDGVFLAENRIEKRLFGRTPEDWWARRARAPPLPALQVSLIEVIPNLPLPAN